jgi:hypothetical protein
MIESFEFQDRDMVATEFAKQAMLLSFAVYLQAKDEIMATRRWRANKEIASAGGMSFPKRQLCDVAILALFEWRNKHCSQNKSRESVAGDIGSELGEFIENLNAASVLRLESKFEMRSLRRIEKQLRDWGGGNSDSVRTWPASNHLSEGSFFRRQNETVCRRVETLFERNMGGTHHKA